MRRPTLEEVAAHAGVSRATASRVVNGSTTVDPTMAQLVRDSIAALRYVPNQAARSLMTRRSATIALVAAENDSRVFGDPFFAAIVRGVSQEAARAGLQLVLSMAQGRDDVARVEEFLQAGSVDGALLISEHDHLDITQQLASTGIPLVVGGRPLSSREQVAFVDHANAEGAELAAQHLLSRGATTIGTITGPGDMSAGVDRLQGFQRGLGDAFDPDLVEVSDFTMTGGRAAAQRLIERRPDVNGLFVASDMMALGAIASLQSTSRRIPEDVAVVGFDDAELAALANPALTTVRQRTTDQGRLMVQVLLAQMGWRVSEPLPEFDQWGLQRQVILPVELIERAST